MDRRYRCAVARTTALVGLKRGRAWLVVEEPPYAPAWRFMASDS